MRRLSRVRRARPELPPPLTRSQLAEAEHELGISLPAAYRRHLLTVSSGGAVSRLERTERGWWWAGDRGSRELLQQPFPDPDSYVAQDEALGDREPRAEDVADEAGHAAAWRAWNDEAEEFEARKTAGSIVARDHGCGFASLLVVTGPLAGTVWWDGRATCDLIVPLSLDHAKGARPVTFDEWVGRDAWDLLPPGWG